MLQSAQNKVVQFGVGDDDSMAYALLAPHNIANTCADRMIAVFPFAVITLNFPLDRRAMPPQLPSDLAVIFALL